MVGNGATDWDFDVSPSFPDIAYNFNLIPKKMFDDYNKLGCKVFFNDFKPTIGSNVTECRILWDGNTGTDTPAPDSMCGLTADLNWYDLYRPKYGEGLSKSERTYKTINNNGEELEYVAGRTFREGTSFLKSIMGESSENMKEYTMDLDASHYFNNNDTKKALHLENFKGSWN